MIVLVTVPDVSSVMFFTHLFWNFLERNPLCCCVAVTGVCLSVMHTLFSSALTKMSDKADKYPQWLGLLKWSLSQTDPNGSSEAMTEMSQENREFLEAVMNDIVKDEPGELQKMLIEFKDMIDRGLTSEDSARILDLLQDTQDIIDQIDMANVFLKFGGATVLKTLLETDGLNEDVKCSASVISGELAQNNPSGQLEMIKHGLLDQLALMCAKPDCSNKLCSKGVLGISCIIRGCKDGESRFCESIAGPALLKRMMLRLDSSVSKRVMFLANALLLSDFCVNFSDDLLASVLPEAFVYLDSPDIDARETFFRLLYTVISLPGKKGIACIEPSMSKLESRLQQLLDEANDEQEKGQIRCLLEKLQSTRALT